MRHMQGAPFGMLLGREAYLSKLEASMNSESQLRNGSELFSALRLSPRWFSGLVEALLKHVDIQDVIVKSVMDWTQPWRLLGIGCSYHLRYGEDT